MNEIKTYKEALSFGIKDLVINLGQSQQSIWEQFEQGWTLLYNPKNNCWDWCPPF